MKPEIIIEENKDKFTAKLAQDIVEIIKSKNEAVNISLSGGNTPVALYEYIADNYVNEVDWNKVYFWWGDERCVPPGDNDSNYKMAKETMLEKLNVPDGNVFRIKGELAPEEAKIQFEELMEKNLPVKDYAPVYDIVLLGLGYDGHTASIFPDQIELFGSEKLAEVAEHPQTGQKRITITGKVINNASNVFFMVTGSKKSSIVNEILNTTGNYKNYPASLAAPVTGSLKWYLDYDAAKIYENR